MPTVLLNAGQFLRLWCYSEIGHCMKLVNYLGPKENISKGWYQELIETDIKSSFLFNIFYSDG